MSKRSVARALLIGLLVVGLVGVLDAVIGAVYDLAVLFGLVVLVAIACLLLGLGRRRSTDLRADLAVALADRSRSTGEPLDQLTDRAIATYLEALAEPEPTR